ncbi:uncharacterized protein LOC112567227 [Pomacea canaliculata]|uniref:uncharacterized protein LOC112567227 n=1 Tax=Pomacea canaliculata TaxID=400727 RepID=UPI000D7256B2|nr:uncharacterized protein LOC112567227 [Pomacea canaliculata]XP_025099625.1 uncharacterized protein LOC112567227 [Pomacea canaliculata]
MEDQYLANSGEVLATFPAIQSSNLRSIQATSQEDYLNIPEQAVLNMGISVSDILRASEDHRRETGKKFEKAVDLYKAIQNYPTSSSPGDVQLQGSLPHGGNDSQTFWASPAVEAVLEFGIRQDVIALVQAIQTREHGAPFDRAKDLLQACDNASLT